MWLGVDVATGRLDLAVLSHEGDVELASIKPDALRAWVADRDITGACVDAPAAWADDAHAGDERVAAKYRRRCSEAMLALRDPPHYVSFASCAVDETDDPAHGWMRTGIAVHRTLAEADMPVDETWPHAAWQRLAEARRLASKSTDDGLVLRRRLLVEEGVAPGPLVDAGHDHLDAVVAALTASRVDADERDRAACPERRHPQRRIGVVLPA